MHLYTCSYLIKLEKRENAVISKEIPLCIRKLVVRGVQNGESHWVVTGDYKINKAAIVKIILNLKIVVHRPGRDRKHITNARTDTKIKR